MTDDDFRRLARWVQQRADEFELSDEDIADAGGPSTTWLSQLRTGKLSGRTLRKPTRRKLEDALLWEPGSVKRILEGGDPTPVQPGVTHPGIVDKIRALVEQSEEDEETKAALLATLDRMQTPDRGREDYKKSG